MITVLSLAACDAGSGESSFASGKKNVAEIELQNRLQQIESDCALPAGFSRFETPGSRSTSKIHEFSNLSFNVIETDLTDAQKLNGITFRGWLHVGPDTVYRWRRYTDPADSFTGGGWGEWSDWGTFINNGSPEQSLGHLLIQKNGEWTYTIDSTLGAGILHHSLLQSLFSNVDYRGSIEFPCDR